MTTPVIQPRWYCVNNIGLATLCRSQRDAESTAADSDRDWPKGAPHQAVLLGDVQALTVVAQNTVALLEYLLGEGLARRKYGPAHRVLTQAREALGVAAAPKDPTT